MKRYPCINREKLVFPVVLLVLWTIFPVIVSGQLVKVPMKWVGITGSPSIDDPTLVGETTTGGGAPGTDGVLWRRHELISDAVLVPECNLTLRSGAFNAIANFPIRLDPSTAVGNDGDVSLGADPVNAPDFTEFCNMIDDARDAWVALGVAGDFGITAVSMNRFTDDMGNTSYPDGTGGSVTTLGLGGFSPTTCDAAIQAVISRAMVIDPAYLRPSSTIPGGNLFNDPNETILGQEVLHALTLDHVGDPTNLMFGSFPNGATLTSAQCDTIRDQSLAHVPGTTASPGPESFVDLRSDTRGDMKKDPIIDIHVFGVARETALKTTHFFLSTAACLPENQAVSISFTFMMDADNNPETGGNAEALEIPTKADGIELVGRVVLDGTAPDIQITTELFRFANGDFQLIEDDRIVGALAKDTVSVLYTTMAKTFAIGQIIWLSVPDELIGELRTVVGFQAVGNNFRLQTIDTTDTEQLTFRNPVFPECSVMPDRIVNGGTVELMATGLPANSVAHIFLGPNPVKAEFITNDQGNLTGRVRLEIPGLDEEKAHLITIGAGETAITADCSVRIVPGRVVRFDLNFLGPDTLVGPPGSTRIESFFCTLTHSGAGPGAQAWSIGVKSENAQITKISLEGTDAESALSDGFEHNELTSGDGNEGAISAVVLALGDPNVTLSPNSTHTIARIEIDLVFTENEVVTLRYVDGLQGIGEPFRNEVTLQQTRFVPELGTKELQLLRSKPFIRGDTNADGSLSITDAVELLGFLFLDTPSDCLDAFDGNDSGKIDLTDAVFLLNFMFQGGSAPPTPFPGCGPDLTPDALDLDCASFPLCDGLPDFLPLKPFPAPAPVGFCDRVGNVLKVHVKNQGTAAAAAEVIVRFEHGPPKSGSTGTINPDGGIGVVEIPIPEPIPPGGFNFKIYVDPNEKVEESNEENNTADGRCIT